MANSRMPAVRAETGVVREVEGREIGIERVYHVPDIHPHGLGPWRDEPDKITWHDADTGLGCIVRRATEGHLEGFVGVDPGHPLHGFHHDALGSGFDIAVHGGLDYSRPCDDGPEERSVCHPDEVVHRGRARAHGAARRWWFGFSADQPYDLVPRKAAGIRRGDEALTRPKVYRTIDYMIGECRALAAQLDAIANGLPLPVRASVPPVGLDPDRAGDGR
ncbi:hypothetical protein HZF05_16355 [Sphingomonas sp. CGMCC 1.13654]|uniref:Uncharacterized protein n=1 Tax=Sphingomonas chungangi TaxID=2683589 RepID=A0A838L9F5_9SPHN|nr:hypothetical protein [Sphingomonas chungangi]MBA2935657.1 hypothetical protein [Sphingomonas chungangi]MVW54348.1 hypothetical protein [Sphingomonas chungangi]